MIQTVTGLVEPEKLGITLMHEHIIVDFRGAKVASRDAYEQDEAFEVALPHLRRLKELGGQTLVECTPAFLGRDPLLLKRLSKATGIQILTNTALYGLYSTEEGKRVHRYLPEYAFKLTAEQIAAVWLAEVVSGIEGTQVFPAFLKLAINDGPLPPVQRKLLRAAAWVHLETGLPIACHTGRGNIEQALDLLEEEGAAGDALIWVHAQGESDMNRHFRAAERGCWVEFDGISDNSVDQHVKLVLGMMERGFLRRTLISHDAGWYTVGEPKGGNYRGYETVFTKFIPALKAQGIGDDEVRTLLVDNPCEVLTPKVRRA